MTENKLTDNMDVVVLIDKEKLPEDVRKILEENLPKEIQEKVMRMLVETPPPMREDKQDYRSEGIDNRLFTVQMGEVVGNIYKEGIYKKEEEIYKPKIKDDSIKDLGGCC